MGKVNKITCETYTRKSIKEGNPVKCKAMGRFIPNSKRFLCGFHNGHRSWAFLTGQYKGLYKNPNLPMINKVYFKVIITWCYNYNIDNIFAL